MRRIDWLAVTVLLLFAASLRILGISYGRLDPEYFPSYVPFGMVHEQLPVQPDEFFNVAIPVNMIMRNRRNPEFFNYPSFIINSNYILYQLTNAIDGWTLEQRNDRSLRAFADYPLYVFSRMYSVVGAMLQVACAYAIAKLVAGRYAGLCAGLLVAVSVTLVQHAHYIKPGSLATAWMMLTAWLCIAALYARRSRQRAVLYVLAGIATGLAATTRYNALAVAPLTLATGCILLYRIRTMSMLSSIALAWALAPIVFFVCSPYILRDFEHFSRDLNYIVNQYVTPGGDVPAYFLVDAWTGMFLVLLQIPLSSLGLPAAISAGLALVGHARGIGAGTLFRWNSIALAVLLFAAVIALYALVALRTIRPGHTDHHLMLILPFVAVLSAIGADWLARILKTPKRINLSLVALILVIQPLILSVQVVRMFKQPDTRSLMLEWIHMHIPSGSRFFLNGSYNVPLDEALFPSVQQFSAYVEPLPDGDDHDYMIYSDALAFDILRSQIIVPAEIAQQQRDYLARLDQTYRRIAAIRRPEWVGAVPMMNMAAFWHNPTLILYCLNQASCENHR